MRYLKEIKVLLPRDMEDEEIDHLKSIIEDHVRDWVTDERGDLAISVWDAF